MDSVIEFINVYKTYKMGKIETKALNNINLDIDNIEDEHICCAIGDPKHQDGVDKKKEWMKDKLEDGHVFRKLDARGKIFIEYEG